MNHERFKDMEKVLEHLEITNLLITSEQSHWLVIHPEEQNKAMRVYRDRKDEITFEWVNAFAAQNDPELKPPCCFDYEQAMFTIDFFGIGYLKKVTLACRPTQWGSSLFNIAPVGLEGLSRQRVVLKEDHLKHGKEAQSIAEAWFLGYQIYSDLKRLSPKANKLKIGTHLGSDYLLLPIPKPIHEFLKTAELFVLVVDNEVYYSESSMGLVLTFYDQVDYRKQNKVTGWKYKEYKAIAWITPEEITYPYSTCEINLESILREAKGENEQKLFREVRDAMTFIDLQRSIKAGGLMSLEIRCGIPQLLNAKGQVIQDYNRYHNPSIHHYLYQIGLDVAYYTENPGELTVDAVK